MASCHGGRRKDRGWPKASAAAHTTGAAPKPASKRRRLLRRQCGRRWPTASTGNLHDCGVTLKRPRGLRTKRRRSSPSWPRWQAVQGAGSGSARMSAKGGFQPVRSRACNLESGHSVYGVAGPKGERQVWRANVKIAAVRKLAVGSAARDPKRTFPIGYPDRI